MPWVGLLLFFAVAYVFVLVVRGLIQVVPWFIETFVEPRRYAQPRERYASRRNDRNAARSSASIHRHEGVRIGFGEKIGSALLGAAFRLARLSGILKRPFTRRDFAYWVGLALVESDPEKKVKYLFPGFATQSELRAAPGDSRH